MKVATYSKLVDGPRCKFSYKRDAMSKFGRCSNQEVLSLGYRDVYIRDYAMRFRMDHRSERP